MMRSILRVLLVLASVTGFVNAQDAVIKVFDSTFNEFANKVQPVTFTGNYKYTVNTWFGPSTICDSNYTATVSQLAFAVSTASVQVTGRVDATWCGVSFNAPLNTTASLSYSSSQRAILISVSPTSIQPRFNVLGFDIPLPMHIDVSSNLEFPPVPLSSAQLYFETPNGPITLGMQPLNVSLTRQAGFVQLRSDVTVW